MKAIFNSFEKAKCATSSPFIERSCPVEVASTGTPHLKCSLRNIR